ncbi:MAG: YgfZ/GcvT domain-containing protein [Woeseiaceae bacterium]
MSEIPYSTISVTGPDAFEFLQAQLTSDLNEIPREIDAQPVRSAWCNPKGRVICMPTVMAVDNGYELSMPTDLADLVVQRMMMFRFRAKVEFTVAAGKKAGGDSALEFLRAGIPEIALAQSEKFTPHMLNLDLLNIVSLDKGCYPGQEIVARTHYRGSSKRRLLLYKSTTAVNPGDKVSDGEREVGEVVNAIDNHLLAVVHLDSTAGPLVVGDTELTPIMLPFAD